MNRLSIGLLSAATMALFSPASFSQQQPCGDITQLGECQGETAIHCSSDNEFSAPDAGTVTDAGTGDGGSLADAGAMDAGMSLMDAGATVADGGVFGGGDAGNIDDGGLVLDGGIISDAGMTNDAGQGVAPGEPYLLITNCADLDITVDGVSTNQSGTCTVFEENDFGVWCIFDEGDHCQLSGGKTYACGANGEIDPNMGCFVDTGKCKSGATACTLPEQVDGGPEVRFERVCNGDNLTLSCTVWGQPSFIDCTNPEYRSTGCSAGTCGGRVEGDECKDRLFSCAEGLVCEGEDKAANIPGTCVEGPDEPEPDVSDDSDDDDVADGDCACSATSGTDESLGEFGLAAGLFFFIGIPLAQRRRKED